MLSDPVSHWFVLTDMEDSGLPLNQHDLLIVSVMQKRINRVIPFIWCELVGKDGEFKLCAARLRG